ncbi:hypothetical protein PHAVU_004G137000 [Phaseolus vulgaris]|uniref:RNase H type-1 domain-containing protein n=1 Tax=Phaseolus vulgaris TaxID=3885 RepID=V7C2W1_PHAVU|nr:hypothetical protein PHAVU_004G137000g [Phaseolus vulgaris]ESW24512.1 hypothetical protein PHAVU_004G137000g [Phaseolus vulgaris]
MIKCDSHVILMAFKNSHIIPWKLRNRWLNCIERARSMSMHISHIFREGKGCPHRLADYGTTCQDFHWWDNIPDFLNDVFFRERYNLPWYRFSS